ncbi:MAG: deoxyribose-phosphate aldolase [Caldisphaera sp.]
MSRVNSLPLNEKELPEKIDHTILKPEDGYDGIIRGIEEVKKYGFRSLVLPLSAVRFASEISNIPLTSVISFPMGNDPLEIKKVQLEKAIDYGAREVDVVINLMDLLSNKIDDVSKEIRELTELAHQLGAKIKFIIETGYLSKNSIIKISKIIEENKGDFIKTSTGFGPRGVTIDDILIIKNSVSKNQKIKASGGIKTAIQAIMFLYVGADILGTSSSVKIVNEFNDAKRYFNNLLNI